MLELKNISFTAHNEDGDKEIIKNVSLTLNEKFIAFTGPNGGGKSTLAKIIMGIIKPTSGRLFLDGEDITDLSITERANKGLAFAFQQPIGYVIAVQTRFRCGNVTAFLYYDGLNHRAVTRVNGYDTSLCEFRNQRQIFHNGRFKIVRHAVNRPTIEYVIFKYGDLCRFD